jgi:ABC-type polysaccharide/polyol phosphate export permease
MTPQYNIILNDIAQGFSSWKLWTRYGYQEVKRRYRRTALGPFWSTTSLGVFIFALGVIWANLWHQDTKTYLPYLSSGMITWVMLSQMISEGCTVFVSGEGLIKQIRFPYTVLVFTLVWRNLIVFAHNMLIYAVVAVWSKTPISPSTLLVLPGLAVICLNTTWLAILVGLLCTRFRDVAQIVTSVLQIVLFVTPIFYPKESLGYSMQVFTEFNPIYQLIDVVRSPLLGKLPAAWSWEFGLIFAIAGWALTLYVYSLFRRRIAYWL